MLRASTLVRKRRFAAALALAGLTLEQWAADERYGGGVTRQHAGLVLKGDRTSPRIERAMEAFIEEMAPAMADAA